MDPMNARFREGGLAGTGREHAFVVRDSCHSPRLLGNAGKRWTPAIDTTRWFAVFADVAELTVR